MSDQRKRGCYAGQPHRLKPLSNILASNPNQLLVSSQVAASNLVPCVDKTTIAAPNGTLLSTTIHGVVFNDLNGNRVQDSGESGIQAVTVSIRQLPGGTLLIATTTDANGAHSYTFSTASDASYTVTETDPSGYASTTPNQVTVFLAAGGTATVNFGDR